LKDVLKRTKNKIHFLVGSFELAYRPIPYDESKRYKKSNRKFMKTLGRKITKNETKFSNRLFQSTFLNCLEKSTKVRFLSQPDEKSTYIASKTKFFMIHESGLWVEQDF
jgi:hypothetical protein